MRRWIAIPCVLVAASGCRPAPAHEAAETHGAQRVAEHADEKEHAAIPRLLKLTPEVIRDANVQLAPADKRRLHVTIDLNGQVVADPDHIAELGARSAGRVMKVMAREGDAVKAGQTLALVSVPELARQRAAYAAASARAIAARKNAARLHSLAAQRLGSDQDAISADADAAALEAERDAAAQMIRAMGAPLAAEGDPSQLTLSAPIAGQVIQRDAVPGQMVDPAHTLVTIADLSRIWFQAQLFEKDLARISEGAEAEVRLNGYPATVFAARVARVSAQVDPQTRTLTARLAIDDPDRRLRLGLFGKARISVAAEETEERVVVPLSAVTDIGDRKVVFVRHPDGDYELHDVTLGQSAGNDVPVLSGLSAGEQVVVSGVHTLKSIVLRGAMQEDE